MLTKFVPFTVSVNAAPPAAAVVGRIVVIVGTGLLLALIVKFKELEATPPDNGFTTVTCTVAAVANSVPGIFAVIAVLLVTVPALEVPLKFTVAPVTNPVPVIVSGFTVEPISAEVGVSEVSTGTAFPTV